MASEKLFIDLIDRIHAVCASKADPAQVAKYARYFKEGFDGWGVHWDDPAWIAQKEEWFQTHRHLGIEGFLELGRLLFQTGKYEDGALAIFFIIRFKDQFRPETLAGLARWFDGGIRNWAHTDVLCGEVLSHFLVGGITGYEALAAWRQSPHKYQRRAVPVTLLPLLKAKGTDVKPLIEFLRPLMMDAERVVQQGTGWFLREAWKKQPEPVEKFLMEWKDSAPRLIFQYATEKMTPKEKERFRKDKAKAKPAGK